MGGSVGEFDGHTFVVLLETGHRTTAPDLRTEFDRMFFEQVNDDRLRDAQQIGVRAPGITPSNPFPAT